MNRYVVNGLFLNLRLIQFEIYYYLQEMDILVQALMYKVGENSIFIREDIDRALQLMIDSMPQTRAALSLITYGSKYVFGLFTFVLFFCFMCDICTATVILMYVVQAHNFFRFWWKRWAP